MKKYKIYPSLVDSFKLFTKFDFISFEEIIDRINRVPRPTPEPALKGIALENCVNDLLSGKKIETDFLKKSGSIIKSYVTQAENKKFLVPVETIDFIVERLWGAEMQVFAKADLKTPVGLVEIYGYSDYVLRDTVTDLKGISSQYSWPKYLNNCQHKTYLYCLNENGIKVNRAEYLITDFTNIYVEDYYWCLKMKTELIGDIAQFVAFLETHRDKITNKKIFGE